jgi:glyoxylase-like metal-dependent hydrolase (beta-lactamase superfamily II)
VLWGTPEPSETAPVDSEIQTKSYRFSVIPTPGHTDDHICLYEPNEGWLFTGDLFIGGQIRYLREDEDIYSILDSLRRIASLPVKMMFCSFSGTVDQPKEAIQKKIGYLEDLGRTIEEGIQQGISLRTIRRRLLGRGDRFRLVTAGQISKQNLINAFLRNPTFSKGKV